MRPRPEAGARHTGAPAAEHVTAISRAIAVMQEHLGEPHRLHDIARTALMSPFHFHRVFRLVTAATPGRFLTAIRMAEAKRLLLETSQSATEISLIVGYSSFGTFTSQFSRLVGMPPGRFRECALPVADLRLSELLGDLPTDVPEVRDGMRGWLGGRPDGARGVAVVALFSTDIPQQAPRACVVTARRGFLMLPDPGTPGPFTVFAASVSWDAPVAAILTESPEAGMYLGTTQASMRQQAVVQMHQFAIRLREPRLTDPPLLTAFPLLLRNQR